MNHCRRHFWIFFQNISIFEPCHFEYANGDGAFTNCIENTSSSSWLSQPFHTAPSATWACVFVTRTEKQSDGRKRSNNSSRALGSNDGKLTRADDFTIFRRVGREPFFVVHSPSAFRNSAASFMHQLSVYNVSPTAVHIWQVCFFDAALGIVVGVAARTYFSEFIQHFSSILPFQDYSRISSSLWDDPRSSKSTKIGPSIRYSSVFRRNFKELLFFLQKLNVCLF